MLIRQLPALIILASLALIGCAQDKQMNRPDTRSAEHHADELSDIINQLNNAQAPAEEADALKKLHKYESDHGLTYTVQAVRMLDGQVMPAASVGADRVTVNVTIFRGQEVVQRFSFVPRDNANLALLGS